ncbi:pyrimidine operon attenuation protein/uracil phosphoribosyltransferase [Pontibacter ummariensis]|uniref:Pyrimidine operon attenuation protein / uracil phosphoribosyltransferase n=1 Tax=Pontibacter ummariensis TaxID=1610492 RepID=A0A239B6A9_9BACT|nr:phosphoribosyltransferase family protein [Pontibacter ummariensis]PRY16301.1 pyrimidine operon attenuation protein/uracil phosphoribosyltransferase [Pontibacter ummariensis]SNS02788.1 pyrimidine operon attenuation protein / uracil phosphoribosyltransferase [Pontibacter ummariensis]
MAPQEQQQNLILDRQQIEQKITRIAYEIYEQNFEAEELVLAGIHPNGYTLAEMLMKRLQQVSTLKVQLLRVTLDKTAPLEQPVELSPKEVSLQDKAVVIVDDVLNTGKTLAYTLHTFLPRNPRKVEIATLVDRHHPLFPVAATYTGYSLATTLNEHVLVRLNEDLYGAYLH